MAKIISLTAVILGCILLTQAEPPASSYAINGENNGFEYTSNVINGAYMVGKEGQRENPDFYSGGSSGHSLISSRNQGNLEETLRSSSYSGFSPSSHNTGFTSYTTGSRENLASSPYFMNTATQSSFDNYASTANTGDTTFDTYAQGSDQVESDFSQFTSSKPKTPSHMRFSDSLAGASSTGSYPELGTEGSSFRGQFPSDGFRTHASQTAGFMDVADQSFNRETSSLFNSPSSSEYPYGKSKDATFAMTGSNKFINEAYPLQSETRYVRGNHGNLGRDYASAMLLANSGGVPFSGVRGAPGAYSSGKYSKYSKYGGDYASNPGLNYLSKEQDVDYLLSNYGKGSAKLPALKEGRPSSYSSQSYLGGPSYLSKLVGGYKSKPSYVSSYPGNSPVGYSSMSSLPSSYSGSSYADSPLMRRYRSSTSSYVPGHVSPYSNYY